MQYRELTTRVVQAGLGVVTFSEEPTSDDDGADPSATREHDDPDSAELGATREHEDPSDRDDDGAAYRATLPTLLEVPDKQEHRQS